MILPTRDTRIVLSVEPVDFRKGVDGFQGLCRTALGQDPTDGTLYVFINRAATMVRALVYHQGGFWLMTERLSTGRFTGWPALGEPVSASSAQTLRVLLAGDRWSQSDATPGAVARAVPTDRSSPGDLRGGSSCATV